MVAILRILVALLGVAGLVVFGLRLWSYTERRDEYDSRRRFAGHTEEGEPPPARPALGLPVSMVVFALVALVALSGAAQVAPTEIAVIENTWTGEFHKLEPGTHIWPFEPRLVPLVTRVTSYSLRRQIIEIGEQPVREKGVLADSSSPGRPVVYFWARGWAFPNRDKIIELHRKYGKDYLENWVERVWVSSLKGVQGERPYDFVGNQRVAFQDLVEVNLQKQLIAGDGEPLVFVSQLAIVDFDFDDKVNSYLDTVAQKEFERQQAEQQVLINLKEQEAEKIAAETNFIVVKRAAEAEREKRIAEAEGKAQAQERLADAQAYEIKATFEAEATGIRALQLALATSPEAYIDYLRASQWDGRLPTTMLGTSPLPFLNIPMEAEHMEDPE